MGSFMPHSYIVTLSDSFDRKTKNLPTVIKTDATYFLRELKDGLVTKKQLIPDSVFPAVISKLLRIKKIHFSLAKIDIKRDPFMILCLSYQDGIIHAFERIMENWHSGYYSHLCRVEDSIKSYFKLRKAFLKKKRYFDVAYIDGYIIGLFQLIPDLSKEAGFPMYYAFNSMPLFDYRSYQKAGLANKKGAKAAYNWAKKEAKKYRSGIVLQHTPFLLGASIEEV